MRDHPDCLPGSPQSLPGHPLLGHLPELRHDPLGFLSRCSRDREGVVRLRFPLVPAVLLLDPADIERVLVTEHRRFAKPVWLRTPAVRRLLGDGLVTTDGDAWRQQRRECQRAFRPDAMNGYGRTMVNLTERAAAAWEPGQSRDILSDMAGITLEVVAQTLFGMDVSEQAEEIGEAMGTLMECFSAPRSLFGLSPLPPTLREIRAMRRFDRLVDDLMAGHFAMGDAAACPVGNGVLLARLGGVSSHDRRNSARDQVKTFLAAGHESSALTLAWAFLLLAQHAEADAKLGSELERVLGGRAPEPEDLTHLAYAEAVIKETLRLYPPLWMTGRRAIAACEIGGCRITRGTLVLTSQWAVQRSAQHFADPDLFRPERWLCEETAHLPKYAYFPFGGGPRVCIGQGFALMEATLMLASIARRFRLLRDDDAAVTPRATMTLRPPAGIRLRLAARG